MPDVFADTSGWGNLFDQAEEHHSNARTILRRVEEQQLRFLTTNYIIAELVSLLISPMRTPHPTIVTVIEELQASKYVNILHIDPKLHDRAWRLFVDRPDKRWSLVDCSSFIIMQDRGLAEALTTDHHFEQAGFVRLLK